MKLNTYSVLTFFLILVILYPFIFYFSEKKITIKNNSETSYKYDMRGFFNIKSISQANLSTYEEIKKINKKYFNEEILINFKPSEKISINNEKDVYLLDRETLSVNEKVQSIVKNDEIVLFTDDEVFYYLNLKDIFNFFNDSLKEIKNFSSSYSLDCTYITQQYKSMSSINYSTFRFYYTVDQTILDRKKYFTNEEILSLFQNCFKNLIETKIKELETYIDYIYQLQKKDLEITKLNFIQGNEILNVDQKKSKEFEKDISQLINNLNNGLKNIELEILFIKPSEIKMKERYIKKFNIYLISFILSFLVSLIIFYLLFFLKDRIKLLKKIF